MSLLRYDEKSFYLDEKPVRIFSGAMHYFRIPREYWYDRLLKLKECGFNTVETYIPWNLHEPEPGQFCFEGMLDIGAFIDTAAQLGLYVILRPGPYICAEWEFGGFPAWLLRDKSLRLRCFDKPYLEAVKRYFTALFAQVVPRLSTRGGNVILVQVENEYGSFGDDKDYLRAIVDMYRELGVDCMLYTADGSAHFMLRGGTLDGIFCAANFGSKPLEAFERFHAFRGGQPDMCGEFWCGWFDHWGEHHHVRTPDSMAGDFTAMLDCGASVNFYMFHGGTNFGFMNGANYTDKLEPTVTSYDYCAPLNEAGDRTAGYYRLRQIMEERFGPFESMTATETPKAAYGEVVLTQKAELFDQKALLSHTIRSAAPLWSEDLGQNVGYTLYSTRVGGGVHGMPLVIEQVRDRAIVFADGQVIDRIDCRKPHQAVTCTFPDDREVRVDILCENMGRVNYGPMLGDQHKGIHGVRFGQCYHFEWTMVPLPMDDLSELVYSDHNGSLGNPGFLRGTWQIVGTPADTFLRLDGFHKGFVRVNGVNIGRYWNDEGPQKTLYVPAPFLRNGENEIVVFETEGTEARCVTFTDVPELG